MKGLTATQCRDGLWNCIYFAIYHNLKDYIVDPEVYRRISLFSKFAAKYVLVFVHFFIFAGTLNAW